MKKLFSLILLAFISTQMWANNYPLIVNVTNGTYSTPQVSSSGSSYTNIGSATNNLTGGYYVKVTVTPSKNTYTLDSWNVSNPYSSTTPSITQSGNSYIIAFRAASYVSQSTGLIVTVVFTDPNATPSTPATTLTAPPVVDLGPNVDVLWSTKNLGADEPTDDGYYYRWGETEPAASYTSSGYTTPSNSLSGTNDVATQKLGSNWRMPTWSEVYQLVNYCTQTPSTTGLTISGNGASIFFPNAGYISGTTKNYKGNSGRVYLWTSTKNSTQAKIIFAFNNQTILYTDGANNTCYEGLPVRAVYVGTTATATFKNGTTTIKTQRVIPGTAPTAPANPTKDADEDYTYAFTGWSTSQNGSVAAIGNINSNTTYYAQFSATPKPVAKYTVTITSPEGGTGTLTVTAGGNTVTSGAELNKNTVITVTATPAEHYTGGAVVMQGETPVALTNNQFTLTGNVTISTNFALETYTITFKDYDGTVLQSSQEPWGSTLTAPDVPEREGYSFTGWSPAISIVSGDQIYTAQYDDYTITIGAMTNGYATLTADGITVSVPAAGGSYSYSEGTTIIVEAVPDKGYHFTTWSDDVTKASRVINEIDDDIEFTPSFAANVAFSMLDTWDQSDFTTNCAAATGVLDVTLTGRSFTANQWATLSVPFDYTMNNEDDLYNAVYGFNTLTLSEGGNSVTFSFIRTNTIKANTPYLIVPHSNIGSVVFYGVTMNTPAEVRKTTDSRVAFVSSLWKQTAYGPNDFYVAAGNTLRYAKTEDKGGSDIKGNRAFFRKIGDAATAPRRAIFVIDGEEREVEITDDAIEEVQNVRKYMENGVLIIERNGVRFNAQGQK